MAGVGSTAAAQNQSAASTPPAGTGTGLAGSQTPLNLGSSNLGYVNPGQYAGWQGNLGNFLNMFNIPQSGQGSGMQALGVNNNTGINVSQPNAGNTFAGFGQYLYPLLGFLSNFLGPTPNTNVATAGSPSVPSPANFGTPAPTSPTQTQPYQPLQGFASTLPGASSTTPGQTSGLNGPQTQPYQPLQGFASTLPGASSTTPGQTATGSGITPAQGSASATPPQPGTRNVADLMRSMGLFG